MTQRSTQRPRRPPRPRGPANEHWEQAPGVKPELCGLEPSEPARDVAQRFAHRLTKGLGGPLARSRPTVSHHTKVLAGAGSLVGEKRGRWT